jgi:hypothetical protein
VKHAYEYEFINNNGDPHYPYKHKRSLCVECRREMNSSFMYPTWDIVRSKEVDECENCGSIKT